MVEDARVIVVGANRAARPRFGAAQRAVPVKKVRAGVRLATTASSGAAAAAAGIKISSIDTPPKAARHSPAAIA